MQEVRFVVQVPLWTSCHHPIRCRANILPRGTQQENKCSPVRLSPEGSPLVRRSSIVRWYAMANPASRRAQHRQTIEAQGSRITLSDAEGKTIAAAPAHIQQIQESMCNEHIPGS
jgi:hypothetical protein